MSTEHIAGVELELGDLLQEFQDVVEELKAPSQSTPFAYERLLNKAKRGTGPRDDGVSDSGVEDSAYSSEASLRSSLNTSEEELNTAGIPTPPKDPASVSHKPIVGHHPRYKAKMGDTGDLQSFIDSLDQQLAE
ncbi:regulator of cell cycle RGCC [Aplochiton taeniatus]